jgi:putative flippase GtrA
MEPNPAPIIPFLYWKMGANANVNRRSIFGQLIIFVAVGASAGVLDFCAMVLLREFLSVDAVIASLVGFACGSTTSYILNRLKTFQSGRPHKEAAWRFAAVSAVGFGLTGILMTVLVNAFRVNYMISRICTIIAISLMNFLAYKFWTFSTHRSVVS